MLEIEKIKELIIEATKAKQFSHSPYSNFKVGASLLTKNGGIFTGTNIESVSFSPTNCAERTAIFTAVSKGIKDFSAIAIVSSGEDFCYPCGVCLQVMSEFVNPETFNIIVTDNKNNHKIHLLKELLPHGFNSFKNEI